MAKRTAGKTASTRRAEISRKTKETDIQASVDLDGAGAAQVATGVGFFDHMLEALAKHGAMDLSLRCKGDYHIDDHHSVEDTGIVLGMAVAKALGDKAGIRRFGFASVPLDEALSQVTVDLSGRAHLTLSGGEKLGKGKVGQFDVELLEDFLGAFAASSGTTMHVEIRAGRNKHHMLEATFKAFARALRQAVERDPKILGVPSTKGVL
ncbi:MAG: imidazoleglycerol-phosphate dehydratase HisB [Planctomycetota bacterium]|nr:imidazoleglycerol-phosphate dehydratase HisB [Planctomycetota bacterium]